ncbi:MAG: DUF899 domain-containing protein [Woeseiaceae bacterium]|nr:DUF899 domain-containing protein [Woeseiaceae bacterium]
MPKVVSDQEWRKARVELLEAEKELQRARDELAARRRELPWRKVDKHYTFESESGDKSLSDLFGDRSQLLVYHFMFGPDWDEGCKSCSFWADNFNGLVPHLAARDVSLVAVSRAPLDKLVAYRHRLGWSFPWVSSLGSDFNADFHVTFDQAAIDAGKAYYNYRDTGDVVEEMPGLSAFKRYEGAVYHTYSTYSRGLDPFNAAYQLLDLTPDGRNEDDLPYTMDWLRRRDEY